MWLKQIIRRSVHGVHLQEARRQGQFAINFSDLSLILSEPRTPTALCKSCKQLDDSRFVAGAQPPFRYTIHGTKDLQEVELTHLEGHKKSAPVRIGNGAADHLQLDIYGEL